MGYGTSAVVSDMMSLTMPEKPLWANVNIGYYTYEAHVLVIC